MQTKRTQLEEAEKSVGSERCPMCEGRDLEISLGCYLNDHTSLEPIAHCRACNYRWLEKPDARSEGRSFASERQSTGITIFPTKKVRNRSPGIRDQTAITHRKILIDGAVAGLLGGLAVAAWFLIIDISVGKPLLTPSLLGSVLLRGTFSAPDAAVVPGFVIGYSAFHFGAFISFGIAAAWLIEATDRQPAMLSAVVLLFACFEFFFLSVVGIVSATALAVLIWWRILVANVLASFVMLGFFLVRHPQLRARLIVRVRQSLNPLRASFVRKDAAAPRSLAR